MRHSVRLLPRTYAIRDSNGNRRLPTFVEVAGEFVHSVNFVSDRRQTLRAVWEAFHVATFVAFAALIFRFLSLRTFVVYAVSVVLLATFVNTIWYHRYCSHRSFSFHHMAWTRMFLWLNPIGFRDEIYTLLHHIHHDIEDEDEDPYGPHLGVFGSYVASGEFEIDSNVTAEEYEKIKRSLSHTGMPFASLASFRRWRSVEWIPHYLARWTFATLLWASVAYGVGGLPVLTAWFAAVFTFTCLMRDFNYRGHSRPDRPRHVDGWDLDRRSMALNQRFYGYIAGEWHNNHHSFRASANCAFRPGQFDLAFVMIKAMHRVGIVERFNDHRPRFEQMFGAG
jgi:fatty-acid desaturase